ncbi:hypothetical protein [Nocardia huaxiensis]|uniref:Integral membrane protein n=1 Tax=Nocardia huaxiensis TaxID=2755382 RepID=A0A7D6V565_9NOCA|nr:hypothetical protein [Nocardia huaxiensis]QLY27801.1 hypothetical protein H0264_20330 [Nocardia huaxiensis]UFS98804.1 hypothetical protein LPY97_13365 [Nocardia huaxiensis]
MIHTDTLAATTIELGIDTRITLAAAGLLFVLALLLGVWKYQQIRTSPDATAHVYVDIAHRATLLYSFATLLLAVFTELSAWPTAVNLIADVVILIFFVAAIAAYIVHGWLRDTTNQFHGQTDKAGTHISMVSLIVGEVGGFLVLFSGFVAGQF